VYALWDYGIRCVIAVSFGDIFASNATKNGLLTAVVSERDANALTEHLAMSEPPVLTVDLHQMTISADSLRVSFVIDPVRRLQLLEGWDDIDLTLRHQAEIEAYRKRRVTEQPWVMPPKL
jgi:3-isopropylmalate/(R)-2-methylmalate dehydratase small subunit